MSEYPTLSQIDPDDILYCLVDDTYGSTGWAAVKLAYPEIVKRLAGLVALGDVAAESGTGKHEVRDNDRDAEWCSCGQAGCKKYLPATGSAVPGEVEKLRAQVAQAAYNTLSRHGIRDVGLVEDEPRYDLGYAVADAVLPLLAAEKARADAAEATVADLRTAARDVLEGKGHLCSVCVGQSPSWDGHDKNPPCRATYRERLAALLLTDGTRSDLRAALADPKPSLDKSIETC